MSIPTVNVTVIVNGQDGMPIEDATVTAKLDREDSYNGLVVRKTMRGKTDASGELVLALFPNILGTTGSQYQVTIQTREGSRRYLVSVPNAACNLSSLLGLTPAPALSAAEIVLRDANAARVAAENAKSAAGGSADEAEGFATAAAESATTADTKAGEVATAADTATTKAGEASSSATAAAASATAAAASAVEAANVSGIPAHAATSAGEALSAHVMLSSTSPAALGTANKGSGTTAAKADHVHPTTGLATLSAANTFTLIQSCAVAPTLAAHLANKQYVDSIVGGGGSGDVVGPASAVSGDIATYNGTTGKLIQDSGLLAANLVRKDANSIIADAIKLIFGTGSDLSIYHDGTNSYIDSITGSLYIRPAASETGILIAPNGAVSLYYDNAVKLATSTTGVTVTGTMAATTVTGANVTTGADPGHTHTAYIPKATFTAKGDLVGFTASGAYARLAVGTNGYVLTADSTAATGLAWKAAAAGGASKWDALVATTNFATTAPSTSTITMATDLTATIKPGMAIRYTLSGTVYYAICTAITASLLTIAGAPLTTTASALTALSYSIFPGMVETIQLFIPGYWADSADTALIVNDLLQPLIWRGAPAQLVKIDAYSRTTDSGGTFPRINARVGATTTDYVSTSNTNAGLAILAAATWYSTVVDIAPTKNSVSYGTVIELKTDANGGNDNAADLSVVLTFVHE